MFRLYFTQPSFILKDGPRVIKVIIHLLNKTNLRSLPAAILSARQRSCSASLRQIIASFDNCRFYPNAVEAQSTPMIAQDCTTIFFEQTDAYVSVGRPIYFLVDGQFVGITRCVTYCWFFAVMTGNYLVCRLD